jgi:hypothetical protein
LVEKDILGNGDNINGRTLGLMRERTNDFLLVLDVIPMMRGVPEHRDVERMLCGCCHY